MYVLKKQKEEKAFNTLIKNRFLQNDQLSSCQWTDQIRALN